MQLPKDQVKITASKLEVAILLRNGINKEAIDWEMEM